MRDRLRAERHRERTVSKDSWDRGLYVTQRSELISMTRQLVIGVRSARGEGGRRDHRARDVGERLPPTTNEEVRKCDKGKESDRATSDAQKHAVDLGQGLISAPEGWTGPKLEPVIANLAISLRNLEKIFEK